MIFFLSLKSHLSPSAQRRWSCMATFRGFLPKFEVIIVWRTDRINWLTISVKDHAHVLSFLEPSEEYVVVQSNDLVALGRQLVGNRWRLVARARRRLPVPGTLCTCTSKLHMHFKVCRQVGNSCSRIRVRSNSPQKSKQSHEGWSLRRQPD